MTRAKLLIPALLASCASEPEGPAGPPSSAHMVATVVDDGCQTGINGFSFRLLYGDTDAPALEDAPGYDCEPLVEDGAFWVLVCVAPTTLGEIFTNRLPGSDGDGTATVTLDGETCVSSYTTVVTVEGE